MSGSNFIGGQRSAAGSVRLHSLDARTGEALPIAFAQATPEEVAAAAQAAEAAFAEYNDLVPERRAPFLDAIADQLDALDDTFEVSLDAFGQPLRNGIAAASGQVRPGLVKSL